MEDEIIPAAGPSETETHVDDQQPSIDTTPEQEPVAPQGGDGGPSKEDLTKGIAKYRNIARELEAEVAKLKAGQPAATNVVPTPAAPTFDADAERGMQLVEERMRAVVAPILEKQEASEREQVTTKFWQDSTARAMAPEIQKEFNALSPNMPYRERLEAAKGMAIANNLPTFQKVYEQRGVEKAYNNQALKSSQVSDNVAGARQLNTEQKSLLEKLQSGEIKAGSSEYVRNRSAILEAEKQQFLG